MSRLTHSMNRPAAIAGVRSAGVKHSGKNSSLHSGTQIKGHMGGVGNYTTNQLPSTMEVDIQNIYAANRYLPRNMLHQNALFRQIYRYDSTAGACIELYSTMPWGPFELVGIKDPTIRRCYEDSLFNIGLEERLPWLTVDYMTIGKYCVHLLFDEKQGLWTDMIQHNPDYIRVTPVPLVNQDPILHFVPPQELRTLSARLLNGGYRLEDPQLMKVLETVAKSQAVQLNNENTFYMPRRCGGNDYYGTSIYSRILQLVLIESALMNANLLNAYRRSGPIRTISPGDDTNYAPEQLDSLALMFMEADEDPAGSTIVLREQVSIETLDTVNSSQWRAFDDWDTIQSAKMAALGFSESFLNGSDSYGTTEINLSVFLERIKALRSTFTHELIRNRICLNLAKAMDFKQVSKAELSHRIRISKTVRDSDYILPTIQWSKSLSPVGDPDWLDRLDKAREAGVPVSLRTYASACGVDFESEKDQMVSDSRDRAEIKKYAVPDDMTASASSFSEFADATPGKKASDRNYLKEFTGKVNVYNFRLLTPDELTRAIRLMKADKNLREELPGFIFSAFQLFLKALSMPYEALTGGEIDKLEVEISKIMDDSPELSEQLTTAMKGIGIDSADSAEQVSDSSEGEDEGTQLDLDKNNTEKADKQVELEDGIAWTSENDYAGDHKTKNLRKQMDVRSDEDLDPMSMVNTETSDKLETEDSLNERIEDAIEKLENDLDTPRDERAGRDVVEELADDLQIPNEPDTTAAPDVNIAIFQKSKSLLKQQVLIARIKESIAHYNRTVSVKKAVEDKLEQLEDIAELKLLFRKARVVDDYCGKLKQRLLRQVRMAKMLCQLELRQSMRKIRLRQVLDSAETVAAPLPPAAGEVAVPLRYEIAPVKPPKVNPYIFTDLSKSPSRITVKRD